MVIFIRQKHITSEVAAPHHAEIDPRCSAHADLAREIDPDQQQDRHEVERVDQTHQQPIHHRDRGNIITRPTAKRRPAIHPRIGAEMRRGIEHRKTDRAIQPIRKIIGQPHLAR